MATAVPPADTPALASNGGAAAAARRTRHPIATFLIRRILAGLATLLVASVLIFAAVQALPGDVASVALGRTATPERVAELRADLQLDRSFPARYATWLGGIVTGDLGESTAALVQGARESVSSLIGTPLRNSLVLAAITVLLLVPLSFGLGVLAALRAGRAADHGISTASLVGNSMPEFLVGTLLIVLFFTQLDWFPPIAAIRPGETPLTHPDALVMPVLTLLTVCLAYAIRLVRATTIEALREDYVAMARLNGYGERTVVWRYAVRNALAPSVQAIAVVVQYLIGGIIVVENVFAYPGIGNELVGAVAARDVQMVSVIALLLAAIYIAINVLADLAVMLLVPRLRTQGR